MAVAARKRGTACSGYGLQIICSTDKAIHAITWRLSIIICNDTWNRNGRPATGMYVGDTCFALPAMLHWPDFQHSEHAFYPIIFGIFFMLVFLLFLRQITPKSRSTIADSACYLSKLNAAP